MLPARNHISRTLVRYKSTQSNLSQAQLALLHVEVRAKSVKKVGLMNDHCHTQNVSNSHKIAHGKLFAYFLYTRVVFSLTSRKQDSLTNRY